MHESEQSSGITLISDICAINKQIDAILQSDSERNADGAESVSGLVQQRGSILEELITWRDSENGRASIAGELELWRELMTAMEIDEKKRIDTMRGFVDKSAGVLRTALQNRLVLQYQNQ